MFSERIAAHPVGYNFPLQNKMVSALQIFKKAREIAITICSGLSHPTRSLRSKGTFWPDFHINIYAFLQPMSPQETGLRL